MDIRTSGGYLFVLILHLYTCACEEIKGQSSQFVLNGTSCLYDNQCPKDSHYTCCQETNFCCPSGYKCCIATNWCCPEDLYCTTDKHKCIDLTAIRVGPMVGGLVGLVAMTVLIVTIIKCCPDYEPEWKKKVRSRSTSDLSTDM